MKSVICLILGGGQGSRLYPLTKDRSKPAVPIGGKYRLIDIPVSNCLNSGINKIFILTQFNSASLNKHINQTYRFDGFGEGFVDILAAEQSMETTDWYQGTADAVRKNLKHITAFLDLKYVLIISGDQIYSMNFEELFNFHIETKADITISVLPVNREDAEGFGILKIDKNRITDFVEKPKDDKLLDSLKAQKFIREKYPTIEKDKEYLGSMGIYLFNREVLLDLLDNNYADFGKEIIPEAIKEKNVYGYLFNGYWEDVGTIKSFWKANIDFAEEHPKFSFYKNTMYTNSRHLAPSKIIKSNIDESIICEGAVISNATIRRAIIGIRSMIGDNVVIENSVIMGADFFESNIGKVFNKEHGLLNIGIGSNTVIKNAIVDKNSRIGENCKIINKNKVKDFDGKNYYIRDYIVIIPKNAIIWDYTEI